MKYRLLKKIMMFTGMVLLFQNSFGITSSDKERVYLVQLINQLNAMKPLIIAAEKEQPKNQRIAFHYTAWRDSKGQIHNGLLEDVTEIQTGIEEKLNSLTIEPRVVNPIRGDYLNQISSGKSS